MTDLAASIEEILARNGENRPKDGASFGDRVIGDHDGVADIEGLEEGKQNLFGLGVERDTNDTKALCAVLASEFVPAFCKVLAGHTMACEDIEQNDLAAQCVEVDVGVVQIEQADLMKADGWGRCANGLGTRKQKQPRNDHTTQERKRGQRLHVYL